MTMMLFRSATKEDLKGIYQLTADSTGLTTLPRDETILKKRLLWSNKSFAKPVSAAENEYYLFILEDTETGTIVGTSAIESAVGHEAPFYSYKISKHSRVCPSLQIRDDYEVLNLVNDYQEMTEMCTLFLSPSYRHSSNGVLLSRARFLFMAQFPERFARLVFAEIRGIVDEQGISPFWNEIGLQFFHMSFAAADALTLSTDKQFIADLMPKTPLYIKLLSQAARAVIGKPHPNSHSAMNILMREGFRYNHYVDIFDGGPCIEASRDQIQSIISSKLIEIKHITDEVGTQRFLVANTHLQFRATVTHVMLNTEQNSCLINRETAELLQVKCGDMVRIVPLHATGIAPARSEIDAPA